MDLSKFNLKSPIFLSYFKSEDAEHNINNQEGTGGVPNL